MFTPPPFCTIENNATVPFPQMIHSLGSGIIVLPVVAVIANVAIAKSFGRYVIVDNETKNIKLIQ